jgi:ATP-dependent Clp protease ATP-binding subunit ClpA
MFERFTERARQVIVLAQEEARTLRHNYIGTEHLLLGLLREEEGVAAKALEALDITVERVREKVVEIVGSGEDQGASQIPFTPRAKKVLEMALRESLSLGHTYIGTEHILLAMMREGEGVAARVLLALNADAVMVRNEIVRLLSGPGGRQARDPGSRGPTTGAWLEGLNILLDRLGMEIRHELDRSPDSGDLLLTLACVQETLAGRALDELAVDRDALWTAIERIRRERLGTMTQVEQQTEEARQAKERAIEANDYEEAARQRDLEREFSARQRAGRIMGPEVMDEIRRLLGLPSPPGAQESL